jgi:Potential Queuosine, Q, salvage protein family
MNPYLSSLRPIWNQPTCVFVERDKLTSFAAEIATEGFPVPEWRGPTFPRTDDDVFVNFIGVGNSINFAFSDFDTHRAFTLMYQQTNWQGAFAMWAALSRALDNGIDFRRLDWLKTLTINDAASLFRGESPLPMLEERVEILRKTGATLSKKFGASYWALVNRSNLWAFGKTGIVEVLVNEFPSFRDESLHHKSGTILKFHKRAQLFAMMYQGRAMSSKRLSWLKDYELLGPIADYSVPNALRAAGILQYSDDLNHRISHGDVIAKDSLFEQEIRAQTVNAQIMLLEEVNRLRQTGTNYLALDYKLWMRGHSTKIRHHLTRTHAY